MAKIGNKRIISKPNQINNTGLEKYPKADCNFFCPCDFCFNMQPFVLKHTETCWTRNMTLVPKTHPHDHFASHSLLKSHIREIKTSISPSPWKGPIFLVSRLQEIPFTGAAKTTDSDDDADDDDDDGRGWGEDLSVTRSVSMEICQYDKSGILGETELFLWQKSGIHCEKARDITTVVLISCIGVTQKCDWFRRRFSRRLRLRLRKQSRYQFYNSWWWFVDMGVSENRGTPKWMVYFMENPIFQWMIWGENPLFSETSICWCNKFWRGLFIFTRPWKNCHQAVLEIRCRWGVGRCEGSRCSECA